MMLLARVEKGWNFGSNRISTTAESEILRRRVLVCACAEVGKRVGQKGAVRCGDAGGARNWRGGSVETADGDGQRISSEVVERSREQECGACKGTEERRSSLSAFQR
jgi:hypothetical protein